MHNGNVLSTPAADGLMVFSVTPIDPSRISTSFSFISEILRWQNPLFPTTDASYCVRDNFVQVYFDGNPPANCVPVQLRAIPGMLIGVRVAVNSQILTVLRSKHDLDQYDVVVGAYFDIFWVWFDLPQL